MNLFIDVSCNLLFRSVIPFGFMPTLFFLFFKALKMLPDKSSTNLPDVSAFLAEFHIIVCGLDSIIARRWMNGMLVGGKPTHSYMLQLQSILLNVCWVNT